MNEFAPQDRIVTVFGGSGFIGRHLVRALARDGWRVRVATRRPDLAFHLQPLGRVGQINAVQANVRYPDSLAAALRGAEAAVNLVGILAPWGKQTFDSVQAEGAGAVARAVAAAGIANFVHMSAIGADARSNSAYARTKAEGEAAVLSALPSATILRPSVVFGPEDQFFNRFAAMARLMPALPLIGGGKTKMQPVYVGDVAEAGARLLRGQGEAGAIYELGGPAVRTMRELLEYVLATIQRRAPAGAAALRRRRAARRHDLDRQQAAARPVAGGIRLHRRSGRIAETGQCRLGRGRLRGPHFGGPRDRAAIDRGDRSDLSLPLPQDRPICRPAAGLIFHAA